MSAHDIWLAGYRTQTVDLACRDCDWTGGDGWFTEYGAEWTEPEECPRCGGDLTVSEPEGSDPDRAYDEMRDREFDRGN